MDKIRVGVVGVGHLGNYHLQKYEKQPQCRIVGVADLLDDRLQAAASRYRCEAFSDYRKMVGCVDAVSVAVPTSAHYAVARAFLEAGVDVLLEKPIATTLEEAQDLVDIAAAQKLVFQIGFVERFNPAVVALGSVIETPLFIEAHRLHPFFERGTDVDVILDLMIHDLDIILKFVSSPVKNVEAVGVPVMSNNVDIANARLTFLNGCVANVTASRISGKTMQKIRFFGIEGYHAVDCAKRELISLKRQIGANGQSEISQNPINIGTHDPLEEEIAAFLKAVAHRTAPPVSGEEALKSLEVALRILDEIRLSLTLFPGPERKILQEIIPVNGHAS